MSSPREARSSLVGLRPWLILAATAVTIFGLFHHLDHIIRGNHSGWPFQEEISPFTFSLLIYVLLLPGLYLTVRGRLVAGYWLVTAIVLFAVVTLAHFVGEEREQPVRDIYAVYSNPLWGLLALADLAAIYLSLALLAGAATLALLRRRQERS